MKRISLIVLPFAFAASCSTRTPPEAPEPDPVTELSATVNEFLDAWYIRKDEAKFWSFVSDDSTLRGNPDAFSGAFTKSLAEVNPADLQLGIDNVDGGFEKHPEFILNPGNQRFAIIKGETLEHDDASDELRTRLELLASTPYFCVLYGVGGEGYLWEGMATFWTRKDGSWKLYTFYGFD